ncbi:MAG: hypothetical protein IJ873_01145, partial [Lachnospiraceae bacterium]|nr:hypothetical protein [Lachnospiraceae bacterium]
MAKLTYWIKPSKCIEGYYEHPCERYLLYSGVSPKDRNVFGLDKPTGSGSAIAARAGDDWEKEVINTFIPSQILHIKKRESDGTVQQFSFQETLGKLSAMERSVSETHRKEYLYQGELLSSDSFKKELFAFDESLYNGEDEELFVNFTKTYPDLIKAEWIDGEVVFSVIDIKLARKMKLPHKIQVAFYIRLLKNVIDEYNQKCPFENRIRAAVNQREGFLWNGGQMAERPFSLREADGFLKEYFSQVLPAFLYMLRDVITQDRNKELKTTLNRCAGQKCEWCENGRQCLNEMKEEGSARIIPHLSAYAQAYAKWLGAPETMRELKGFASVEENRRLLSCNRSWDYILSDGATLEVQTKAKPYDWDRIRTAGYEWKNRRSLTMPKWQDVAVILTAQKYAGDNRVYALGAYVKEYGKTTGESGIFIAKDPSDRTYHQTIRAFVEYLYGVLERYDSGNRQENDEKKRKSLQGYVMDSYELTNVEEVLYEALEADQDSSVREKIMGILFWLQGEKLVETGGDKPSEEAEYPVVVLGSELKKLVSLPLAVAYRLPEVAAAMQVHTKKDQSFTRKDFQDYFELISNVMRSEAIHKAWTKGKPELTEDIKKHIGKRFSAEGNLLIKLQNEGRGNGHLVRGISKFYLPGRIALKKELLKKWWFEVKLENLLSCHQIRSIRLKGIDEAMETGDILKLWIEEVEEEP